MSPKETPEQEQTHLTRSQAEAERAGRAETPSAEQAGGIAPEGGAAAQDTPVFDRGDDLPVASQEAIPSDAENNVLPGNDPLKDDLEGGGLSQEDDKITSEINDAQAPE